MPHAKQPIRDGAKECFECKQWKPFIDFSKDITKSSGLRGKCKVCSRRFAKIHYHSSDVIKERNKSYRRKSRLKRRYSLTIDDYNLLLKEQNNSCAICKLSFSQEVPYIDHCHKTGIVRGILCNNCNNGLGRFKDNEVFLSAAIQYLKESNG